jgi:hypothetical protein
MARVFAAGGALLHSFIAPALIKLALPTVLVLLMTPAAEHEARPAFCMVRRSPACEQNAVAGAFAFLTT